MIDDGRKRYFGCGRGACFDGFVVVCFVDYGVVVCLALLVRSLLGDGQTRGNRGRVPFARGALDRA